MVRIFRLMQVLLYLNFLEFSEPLQACNGTAFTNIPPIISRVYENQNLIAVACFLPGWAKDLSAPLY
jgi:hypothetical protein